MRSWSDILSTLGEHDDTDHDDGELLMTATPDPAPELPEPPLSRRPEVAGWDEAWRNLGESYATAEGSTTKVVLYPISALGLALGRDTTTLRKWERKGWLPKPTRLGPMMGRGRRRLYTAEEIEGLIHAADICDLLVDVRTKRTFPGDTRFPKMAKAVMHGG